MARTLFLKFLISIWFFPVLANGQEPYKRTLDSMYQNFTKLKSIPEKDVAAVRDAIYDLNNNGFQDLAESRTFLFLKLTREKGSLKDQALLYYTLGSIYRKMGKPSKAIEAYEKNLSLLEKSGNEESMGPTYTQIGNVYYDTGQHEKAMEMQLQSLSINQKYGNKKRIAHTLSCIGFMLADDKRYNEAIGYFKKSLNISKELNDSTQIAANYTHLGITKHTLKAYDSSLYYLNKSLKYAEPIGFDYMVGYVLEYMGKIYTDQKDYAKAKEYIGKSLELRLKKNEPIDIAQSRLSLAWIYIYENKPTQAIELAQQALATSKEIDFLTGKENANKALSKAHELNGDYHKALNYYKDYKTIFDSLTNIEKNKAIDKVNTQIKIEQETYAVKLKQAKQQGFFNTVLIVLAMAFILLTIGFFYSRKRQKQKNGLMLKLKELEAEQKILVSAQNERKKISQDLHDDLGTVISAIKLVVTNSYGNDKSLLKMVEKANYDVREFFTRIALSGSENNQLSRAIKTTTENLNRTNQLTFEYIEVGNESLIPIDFVQPLSRIAIELMVNVAKHAQATECTVQLIIEDNEVQIMVEDNGKGFNPKTIKKGMGIDSIYARTNRWNGEVHISSGTNGTTSIIKLPINKNNMDEARAV
ncbi:tetratricopeptide repeat protein [Mariniflexile sp. HMF6888]|uniref:tetratricopeptide repeat-containing sensor histidine kinase n=1 Tax=Mariniflexile sp. HMF6888 TaxID=3373086 RepID=UPI0037944470